MRKLGLLGMVGLVFSAAGGTVSAQTDETRSPWVTITVGDLEQMHQTILDTHPGVADQDNPEFRQWTEEGLRQARTRAANVRNFYDYKRTLMFYANGFKDNHVEVRFNVDSIRRQWPGFLPVAANNQLRVSLSRVAEVPVGAVIRSCDGTPAWQLLEQRVLQYRFNPRVTPLLERMGAFLFLNDPADAAAQIRQCELDVNGQPRQVNLSWRPVSGDEAVRLQREALGLVAPPLGLHKLNGLWFVTMSSFQVNTPDQANEYRRFIADITAHQDALRREPLVLDLRGVPGGVSLWGREVIRAIWGQPWIDYIGPQVRNATDWRATPINVRLHEETAAQLESQGVASEARFYRDLAVRMRVAIAQGRPFVRTTESDSSERGQPPANPVAGPVYILTDGICASACLDFVDIAIRLPGARQVGLPTAADTNYIENRFFDLPSGLARLTSSTKVLRDRARRSNQWFEPSTRWPGGPMTDEAVAQWIAGLPR